MKRLSKRALAKHKRRFLRFFPRGFEDERYTEWERTYKWDAHRHFIRLLGKSEFKQLIERGQFLEIGQRALQVESGTNFLFSFEKMALRDALRTTHGAENFASGLYQLLHGRESLKDRFVQWIMAVAEMPRTKSRVLSWPILTFFPFIAQPSRYMILKPTAMRVAATELDYDFDYSSKPSFRTYESLMEFAELTRAGIADLNPLNFHDIQTFLWVIGSAEYERIEEELSSE